jgi:hypothetical protein
LHVTDRRSSASRFAAQPSRPCSARTASSAAGLSARRDRSHRFGSGCRITIRWTRSPGRRVNGVLGFSMPFSYSASTTRGTGILPVMFMARMAMPRLP